MNPFRFQYQKILELKHKDVDEAKSNYSIAAKELESAKVVHEEYKQQESKLQRNLASTKSISTHNLCNGYQYYLQVKKAREIQFTKIRELEKILIIRHKELMQMYKEEKKWDKLSEKQKAAHNKEQSKIEQETLDEISLRKYSVKK